MAVMAVVVVIADLGRGDSLTFGTGVLMRLFGVCIWNTAKLFGGLKFQSPKCATCSLKFEVGEIIWGLIFLVCHCPSHFLSIKFFFLNWKAEF